ncbi:hypothetical protein AB0H92_29035, partial [Streptomyces phaeochromogenes]
GAVDAHWAAGQVYDYFKNKHGRTPTTGPHAAPTPRAPPPPTPRAPPPPTLPPPTLPTLPTPPSPSSWTTPNGPTTSPSRPSPSPCAACGPIVCSFSSSCGTPRTHGWPRGCGGCSRRTTPCAYGSTGSGPPNWPNSAEGWAYGDSPHRPPHGCTRTPPATPSM